MTGPGIEGGCISRLQIELSNGKGAEHEAWLSRKRNEDVFLAETLPAGCPDEGSRMASLCRRAVRRQGPRDSGRVADHYRDLRSVLCACLRSGCGNQSRRRSKPDEHGVDVARRISRFWHAGWFHNAGSGLLPFTGDRQRTDGMRG